MRYLGVALAAWVLVALVGMANAQGINAGEYGGTCPADGSPCFEGVCNRSIDMCVSCGMPGQAACEDQNGQPVCYSENLGNRSVALADGRVVCALDASQDCGNVGAEACRGADGVAFCRFGVLIPSAIGRDGIAVCEACGEYGQPCCIDTAYACDYGSCQGGLCMPDQASADDQIKALIADCNFSAARPMIAALPTGNPARVSLEAALAAASAREDAVRALYRQAQARAREAKAFLEGGDSSAASLAFTDVHNILSRARGQTACTRTMATLDEAIAMTDRNINRSDTGATLYAARDMIRMCNFEYATELLASVPAGTPERNELAEALGEAKTREARVVDMYDAADALAVRGKAAYDAGDYDAAVDLYNRAHQGYLNARQLTQCGDVRNVIDEAVYVLGQHLDSAYDRQDQARPSNQPDIGTSVTNAQQPPEIMPAGPHPCFDSTVPEDGRVNAYSGFGGGFTDYAKKGPFICGLNGEFTLLYGGVMQAYDCDQVGNRYENCIETNRQVISSESAVYDGYVYRYDEDSKWIVVHPPE